MAWPIQRSHHQQLLIRVHKIMRNNINEKKIINLY